MTRLRVEPDVHAGRWLVFDSKDEMVVAMVFDEAIARLIAAAPETTAERDRLREVLEGILAVLPDTKEQDHDCWEWCWNELTDEAQEQVVAARRATYAAIAAIKNGGG